ncbi:ribonuclease HII [uncultured Limosilactobacillus sp.]|uniref:ribonuclease HII n=1 Tax=uncultured Limosilactobacillus sp. TaxID=2837629 RepID=UPI0025EB53C7|nr:ribonuclease HII [uncultured Limosilactobacillus sp.]
MNDHQLTISDIKKRLQKISNLEDPFVLALSNDQRKGVQSALEQLKKRLKKQAQAKVAFQARFKYERELWSRGHQWVAGIDEVGRGPLAGPVVTCAVILNEDFNLIGVTDSKQLTPHEREQLYLQIVDQAVEVRLAVNSATVIDQMNIYAATQDAMLRCVNSLHHQPTHLIVDAVPLDTSIDQTTLIKGDQKSISVATASIVAKEYRDHLMATYDRLYPGYNFKDNMGYGTAKHLAGLAELGASPIHRRTFNPVPKYL